MKKLKMTKEERNAKSRAYYAENREAIARSSAAWREKNIEHAREVQRLYRERKKSETAANKKERKKEQKIIRRAAGGRISMGLISRLYSRQKGLCVYCGTSPDPVFHVDHRMPVALGGLSVDDNLQLLCPKCNVAKGATHPDDYEAGIGFNRKVDAWLAE